MFAKLKVGDWVRPTGYGIDEVAKITKIEPLNLTTLYEQKMIHVRQKSNGLQFTGIMSDSADPMNSSHVKVKTDGLGRPVGFKFATEIGDHARISEGSGISSGEKVQVLGDSLKNRSHAWRGVKYLEGSRKGTHDDFPVDRLEKI